MNDRVISAYLITNKINGKQYVGVTVKADPTDRWAEHIARSKGARRGYLHNAIRKHGPLKFEFRVIAEAYSAAEAVVLERALIAQYGTFWPNGYNLTTGGETNVGFTTSAATKAKQRAAYEARMADPEFRAKWAEGMARRDADPEFWARRNAALATPEHRALVSKMTTERMADPENRRRISEATKAAFAAPEVRAERKRLRLEQWQRPGFREKHAEAMKPARAVQGDVQRRVWLDPEYRARQSEVQKAVWKDDPEYWLKRSAAQKTRLNNPETKRKMSEAGKLRNARRYANKAPKPEPKGARANPEYRAAQSAKIKALWAEPWYRENQIYQQMIRHKTGQCTEHPVMIIPMGLGG